MGITGGIGCFGTIGPGSQQSMIERLGSAMVLGVCGSSSRLKDIFNPS